MKWIALAGMLLVTGCLKTGAVNDYCDHAFAIRPNEEAIEYMDDRFVNDVLKHNEIGHGLCGWKRN